MSWRIFRLSPRLVPVQPRAACPRKRRCWRRRRFVLKSCAPFPCGSVNFENKVNEKGERLIWLDRAVVDRLRSLRGPGESYSDVMRLAEEG